MSKLELTLTDGAPKHRIESDYIGPHHAYGPGFHMSFGAPSFILKDRGKEWLTEWDRYAGPTVVTKKGDIAKNQPGEKSRFWLVAQWWHDQGGKVVDGVGVWQEPRIIETRWTKVNRRNLIADPNGEIVMRHYEGYERWGLIK